MGEESQQVLVSAVYCKLSGFQCGFKDQVRRSIFLTNFERKAQIRSKTKAVSL